MTYQKIPIGSDVFVKERIRQKMLSLQEAVLAIASIPHRHEACAFLRSCAAEYCVVYIMRTIPPRQIGELLMRLFILLIKKGFDKLIGAIIQGKWWRIPQLQPKFGEMAMRTGFYTYGAHHLISLTKTAPHVSRIERDYDGIAVTRLEK